MDLKKYLMDRVPGMDEAGVWHVAKVILNKEQFVQEPLVTKAMGVSSRRCKYCQKEQEVSSKAHVFCRRHLMYYELRKYYLFEATPVIKINDLYIFLQKYAIKWFENIVVCSFSSKSVSKKDIYHLLKFSFLKKDIEPVDFSDLIDMSEIMNETTLTADLPFANLILEKNNTQNFVVKELIELAPSPE